MPDRAGPVAGHTFFGYNAQAEGYVCECGLVLSRGLLTAESVAVVGLRDQWQAHKSEHRQPA